MITNKDILSVDYKQEKRLYTKLLRDWAKVNDTNQFDMSILILSTFYRCCNIMETFIIKKGLNSEFKAFIKDLECRYEIAFERIHDFRDNIEKKIVPRFGDDLNG